MDRKDLENLVARRTSELAEMNSLLQAELADRRHAEEALRESEEKFRILAEKSVVGIYLIQNGQFQYINSKFAEIFEYQMEEFPSPAWVRDAVFPDDMHLVEEALRRRTSGELASLLYEFRIQTKSRNVKYVEVYSSRTFYKGQPAVIGTLLDITERRKMAEALAGSEKRFRQLADATFEGIIIHDTSQILDLNQAIVQMSGYRHEELIGRDLLDFVTPAFKELVLRKMQSEDSGTFEMQMTRKDGSLRVIEAMGRPILYDGKQAKVVALHDVTERKRMAESLRKSEERYKLITDNMTDMVWLIGMDLKMIWISPSAERNRGFTLDEVNSGPLDRYFTSDSLAIVSQAIAEELTPEKLRQKDLNLERILELELFRRDGSTIWIEVSFTLLRDQQGLPIGILGVGRDISRRKRAEQALKISEERFSKIFHTSPIATSIATIDEGRYIDVNESYLLMSGYAREEVIGHTSSELKIWVNPDGRRTFFRMLTQQGFVRGADFPVRNKTGEIRDILLSAEIITLNEGKFILAICYDVTEQKKLEEQLRQAQKMEAIGTLAGGIAHDFNNILGGIMGYTELIMTQHVGQDHPARQFLEGTLRGIHRAKELVAQMMTFSRQQEQKRIPLKMGPIIKEALKLLRASLPATIAICAHITPTEGAVFADPTQIHQVLINLATNGAHAMKGTKGNLDVSLQPVIFGTADTLPHHDLKPGIEYQELTVRDSGCGIETEIIPRIFDPFFTTKKTGEGTGLGLSVVYGIIKSYDGVIAVESEPGRGTAFRVYIPTVASAVTREYTNDNTLSGGRESILLVDDELPLTEVLKILLTKLGYSVTAFNDPLDALDDFKKHPADYDLVITDMTMPHMTGTELARELVRIRNIPVVLCTGMIEKIDHARFRRLGIRKFISKPVTINQLAAAVRHIFDNP